MNYLSRRSGGHGYAWGRYRPWTEVSPCCAWPPELCAASSRIPTEAKTPAPLQLPSSLELVGAPWVGGVPGASAGRRKAPRRRRGQRVSRGRGTHVAVHPLVDQQGHPRVLDPPFLGLGHGSIRGARTAICVAVISPRTDEREPGAPEGVGTSQGSCGALPLRKRPLGVLDLVEVHEDKEEVDEGLGLTLEPVEPDEGLVDIARLVPSHRVVRGEVRVGVGSWGGLGMLAQEVPQTVVDDLVVGVVPTSACPGGDLREDVIRQR